MFSLRNAFKIFQNKLCLLRAKKCSPDKNKWLWPIMPGFNYLASHRICVSAVKPKPFQQAEIGWWGRCLPILSFILFPPTQHCFHANQIFGAYRASTEILTLHAPGRQLSCQAAAELDRFLVWRLHSALCNKRQQELLYG